MPNGFPDPESYEFGIRSSDTKRGLAVGNLAGGRYQNWRSLVRKYTKASLTFNSDRLIAIAGLASWWSIQHNEEYLAGLWKSKLQHELLWNIKPGQSSLDTEYYAPSWSWASVSGNIQHEIALQKEADSLLQFIAGDIKYVNEENKFGQVVSGSLTLKAPLGAISSKRLSLKRHERAIVMMAGDDGENSYSTPSAMTFLLDFANDLCQSIISDDLEIFILPINYSMRRRLVTGLVLKQTSKNPIEFKRLGLFSRRGWEESVSVEQACEHFSEQPLAELLEPETGDHGYTRYTVTIL